MEVPATELGGHQFASWGRRLAAVVIDGAILGTVVVATALVAGVSPEQLNAEIRAADGIFALLLFVVPEAVYDTLMIGSRSQTIGKMAMRIAVVDVADGRGRIGYRRAFMRWVVTNLLWTLWLVPGILDHLWPLRDKRRQAWHDKAARTVVVRRP